MIIPDFVVGILVVLIGLSIIGIIGVCREERERIRRFTEV